MVSQKIAEYRKLRDALPSEESKPGLVISISRANKLMPSPA
jgi:hypothetical protein